MTVLTLEMYRNEGDMGNIQIPWQEWIGCLGEKSDPTSEIVESQADSYANTIGLLCGQMVMHVLMYRDYSVDTCAASDNGDYEELIDFNEWLRIIARTLDVVELPEYIDLYNYRVVDETGRVRSSGNFDLRHFICTQASADVCGGWCMFKNVDWDLLFEFIGDNGGELNIEEYIRGYEYRYL